ncbi:1,3-beta-D-glucan synthase [Aureococcus anophagefferens]|nr:1,3-beta-D-glucan synthase [Aureococcus anophagefferens]
MVLDIAQEYSPSPAMAEGEPYVWGYMRNIKRDLSKAGFVSLEETKVVPNHATMWLCRTNIMPRPAGKNNILKINLGDAGLAAKRRGAARGDARPSPRRREMHASPFPVHPLSAIPIIDGYVEQFGFQAASAACQLEHLLSLLESQTRCWKSRETALARLHRLTLEGYAAWLEDTELEEAPAPPALFRRRPGDRAALPALVGREGARRAGRGAYLDDVVAPLWRYMFSRTYAGLAVKGATSRPTLKEDVSYVTDQHYDDVDEQLMTRRRLRALVVRADAGAGARRSGVHADRRPAGAHVVRPPARPGVPRRARGLCFDGKRCRRSCDWAASMRRAKSFSEPHDVRAFVAGHSRFLSLAALEFGYLLYLALALEDRTAGAGDVFLPIAASAALALASDACDASLHPHRGAFGHVPRRLYVATAVHVGAVVAPVAYRLFFDDSHAAVVVACGVFAARASSSGLTLSDDSWRLRRWASRRTQTLYRTISGLHKYSDALKLLCTAENPSMTSAEVDAVVDSKFSLVVAMQRLPSFTAEERECLDELFYEFPNLRVAYVEAAERDGGAFYACVGALRAAARAPRYRVRLPGHPILGHGKGDNQNHALIFTSGEVLQCIDANQDSYLETALMVNCVLAEFNEAHVERAGGARRCAILGFREHIFSSSLGSCGDLAASQEAVFGTLVQRVLSNPLSARQHYGHPDFVDKLRMMQQGGVSKAVRGLHLSEDIFSGFATQLGGGSIVHREYCQVGKGRDLDFNSIMSFYSKLAQGNAQQLLTRQVYRLGRFAPFTQMLANYVAHCGFFVTQVLICAGTDATALGLLALALVDESGPRRRGSRSSSPRRGRRDIIDTEDAKTRSDRRATATFV